MKYNHMVDVAFSVVTTESDPRKISYNSMLIALTRRLAYLMEHKNEEAFGFNDSYEIQERNKESV